MELFRIMVFTKPRQFVIILYEKRLEQDREANAVFTFEHS